MTLWVKRSWLILGLAFFIFACEDPGVIGLDLNPENGVFVARYQQLFLDNSVILHEDVLSDNSARIDSIGSIGYAGRLLSGDFENQNFGKLHATGYAGLYLALRGFSNATSGYIFDSLIFYMKADYLYGNSQLGTKQIRVHELADSLKLDTLYLTKNTTPYLADPVGEFNFDVSVADTVWVDTVFTTRLSDELGLRFMEEATVNDTTFSSNDEFRKFFDGFAFVADESNDIVTGLIPENSFIRMYFHNSKDTTSFDFIFQDVLDTLGGNITKYYNNITLDRAGTPIAGIQDYNTEFQTDNGLSYIQASTGVFTKLNMKEYLSFLDTIDFMVINRAELEIPVEEYTINTIPTSSLGVYVVNEDNEFIEEYVNGRSTPVYQTLSGVTLSFVKDYNENKGTYTSDVTQYIQDLASGESSDSLLLLGQSNLWNSVISINQSVIKKDSIRLNIYYSTLQ